MTASRGIMDNRTDGVIFHELPNELVFNIFSFLLPHQLTGLAMSSHRAMKLTNEYFGGWLPLSKGEYTSATHMWTHAFKSHTPALQHALEIVVGLLPRLDIFSPIGEEMSTLYLETAAARGYAQEGYARLTSRSIENATKAAKEAGLPPPDLSNVLRKCWEVKIAAQTAAAREYAQKGDARLTSMSIEKATKAAEEAGLPPPDLSNVLQTCLEVNAREQ